VSAAAANRDQLEDGADDAQVAAAEADLASAITQQKIADDRHEATMRCFSFSLPAGEPVTLPDGTVITLTERLEETFCPALGVPEEQARYSLRAADAGLAAARLRLDELLAGPDAEQVRAARANVWSASAQRDAVQAQLDLLLEGATDEQVAAAEAGVEQARAALQQSELSLEQATLSAPFDGVVAAVNVTSGEIASTLPAITLVDTSSFHVAVSVDEIDVGRLAEGQSADVTLDAFPDVVVPGVIERIAPAATLEGGVVYYDVVVELGRTDVAVRAGMTANASIVVDELADVLTIPTWVVRVDRSAGQTYVQRRTADGDVERVDVVLGVRREGVAQVLGGLAEGDEVVWVQDDPFDFEPR